MPLDPSTKSFADLELLHQRYIDAGREKDATFSAIKFELEKRFACKFDVMETVDFLQSAARQGKFVSYSEIADHFGVPWRLARRPIAPHLDAVCTYAHKQGWPLLTAIVVNKDNILTGKLEAESLEGFRKIAAELGFEFLDAKKFLSEQQQQVFAWARTGGSS